MMKKSLVLIYITACLLLMTASFFPGALLAQTHFESGDGWGTAGWGAYTAMTETPAGTGKYLISLSNTGTGNKYFRTANGAGTNRYGPSGTSDVLLAKDGTLNSLQDWNSGNNKANYINVSSTSYVYAFKTNGATSKQMLIFEVQGALRTISSVAKSPAMPASSDVVTVTATISAAFNTGQSAYLRYTTNNWSTSTVVEMTGAATSYTASIPAQTNCTSVAYYVFTSGSGLTISGANADWYTINLNNNSGSNYTYTIGTGCCPSHTCTRTMASGSSTTVVAGETVCINSNYTSGTITLNAGTLFIESGGTIDYSTRITLGNTASRTITSCGTLNFSATGDFDISGASGNFLTIENYGAMTSSQAGASTFYVDDYNVLKNYGTMNMTGNLIMRQGNGGDASSIGAVYNYSGGTINVTTKIDIDRGPFYNYGTIKSYDLEVRNNANASMTLYDGSITRVTHDLYSKTNGFTYGDASGTAYINHTGGNNTNPGGALSASSSIKYCGPITTNRGSVTTGTDCPYPLPVEFIYFTAKPEVGKVNISWATGSEINNDYFTIERTADGFNFEIAGYVKGAGNSTQLLNYSFVDDEPVPGISYYRIRQTDFDGKYEVTNIVAVNFNIEGGDWMIYPNPAANEDVYISFSSATKEAGVFIYDMMGNKLYEKYIRSGFEDPLMFFHSADFSKGLYLVKIMSGHQLKAQKLIIE